MSAGDGFRCVALARSFLQLKFIFVPSPDRSPHYECNNYVAVFVLLDVKMRLCNDEMMQRGSCVSEYLT